MAQTITNEVVNIEYEEEHKRITSEVANIEYDNLYKRITNVALMIEYRALDVVAIMGIGQYYG
jgi:hypothetical protein